MLRTAFDLGITHFDLANNYGPPYGSAETNFGRLLREDFKPYRDELIISSKAGWDMWPGPYGKGGGSRKYVLASLDQSLQRLGLDYVDIFYSHRFDPDTPLEETASALAQAVQQGKALYIGISSYSAGKTREIAALLREWKVPLLIHQPAYNLFNRWIEKDLLDATDELGAGVHRVHAARAGPAHRQVPEGHSGRRAHQPPGGGSLKQEHLSDDNIERAARSTRSRSAAARAWRSWR
jgi:L-glyceraldehyde 3-phosphate reductase